MDFDKVYVLGVDTGGTFTDFVYYRHGQLIIHKVLSTPHAPEQAILQGIKELGLESYLNKLSIVHGSTVATNAVLEKKGVKTVYVSNTGLSDILTIGRQARKELYNLSPKPEKPPVEKSLCFEMNSRVAADGEILTSFSENELQELIKFIKQHEPDAVAINFIFSFLNDTDEKRLELNLRKYFPDLFISRSSQVLPEYKEYERGIATWLNAWVGPLVQGYLTRLSQAVEPAPLAVMQSSGGTIAAAQAAQNAVRMLLSGPAGGLAGAKYIADYRLQHLSEVIEQKNLLTFDMGGTSTDVALIEGELQLTSEGSIGDYPVAISMVDMHTIGAGGGSIARVDEGGILQVGPQSAGASPGPACYGQGGQLATVTDANMVLGRLSADSFLGGRMQLDEMSAYNAVAEIADQLHDPLSKTVEDSLLKTVDDSISKTAAGIIQVANEHMTRALRVMSIQRGIDPKELVLVPFGGAGGLHVCALAENLQMTQIMVPVNAGVLSAFGMVVAPHSRDISHTINIILDINDKACAANIDLINQYFSEIEQTGIAELLSEGINESEISTNCSVDLRYVGQTYTLNVPWTNVNDTLEKYHKVHKKRYGHRHYYAVELVNIRIKVSSVPVKLDLPEITPNIHLSKKMLLQKKIYGVEQTVPVYQRELLMSGQEILGPALIVEEVSTTWLAPHWQCTVDAIGNLSLEKNGF
ncbi:MAG: hydantoinase/oxoprolinase family protein [gamma proteobacterium symbiont of Taylorina sp.]|nr:hydantoinase/oxoprolinase family protein [gamma proteobacterium symbiont of Taylorina sp.]